MTVPSYFFTALVGLTLTIDSGFASLANKSGRQNLESQFRSQYPDTNHVESDALGGLKPASRLKQCVKVYEYEKEVTLGEYNTKKVPNMNRIKNKSLVCEDTTLECENVKINVVKCPLNKVKFESGLQTQDFFIMDAYYQNCYFIVAPSQEDDKKFVINSYQCVK